MLSGLIYSFGKNSLFFVITILGVSIYINTQYILLAAFNKQKKYLKKKKIETFTRTGISPPRGVMAVGGFPMYF